jgi:hypothetical protein
MKRKRGRQWGSRKPGDRVLLREAARRSIDDPKFRFTTFARNFIIENGNEDRKFSTSLRNLQARWKEDGPILREEARLRTQTEPYDPRRHANAPKGTRVLVNANDRELWNEVSLAGWQQVHGWPTGEWIMRRDFPTGFISPEDMPKYLEECGRLMATMLEGLD